jgi:hypothetical protein
LLPESEADFVIVDMDSMYGPMSWLRLHAASKQVIGLTTAARTQTDFRLERPFDTGDLAALLAELAATTGITLGSAETAPAKPVTPPAAVAPVAPAPAPPAPSQPAPAPPAAVPPAAATTPPAPRPQPAVAATARPAAPVTAPQPAAKAPPPPTTPAPAAQPAPAGTSSLAAWLVDDRIKGRVRFARGGASVLIDANARQYFGNPALKPLAPLFEGNVAAGDLRTLDNATWTAEAAALGEPQPLARLVWLGGLLVGAGRIASGYNPHGRYHMLKWPQTEREYPKHFRIATVMMKGPATLGEIAAASGVPETDVADFINANLATGFAEEYHEPEPDAEAPRSGGLFGRLRGR